MCPCNQYLPYNLRRQAKIGEIEEVQGTVGERTSIIHIGQTVTHLPDSTVYILIIYMYGNSLEAYTCT